MIGDDTPFGRELGIFSREQESAQQFFCTYLTLREVAWRDEGLLKQLNTTPTFWLVTDHALILSTFIVLGRIFDQRSPHNIDRVLALAGDDLSVFSMSALIDRKVADGLKREQASEFAKDCYLPVAADFRKLRKEVAGQRKIYEARYRDVRDKIFAHKALSDSGAVAALMANTNIEEMKALLTFLDALHDALWQLLANGYAPVLRQRPLVLPPAVKVPGKSTMAGERAAREAEAFFAAMRRQDEH